MKKRKRNRLTRVEGAEACAYKHDRWLADLPATAAAPLKAMTS